MLRDIREQVAVLLGIRHGARVGLDDYGSDGPTSGLERRAEPDALVVERADQLHLAPRHQRTLILRQQKLRLAYPEQVCRDTCSVAGAERLPQIRLRYVGVVVVDEVREVDHLALVVVERDVEVRSVHQFADRRVDRAIEGRQIARRRGRLCYAVQNAPDITRLTIDNLGHSELLPAAHPVRRGRRAQAGTAGHSRARWWTRHAPTR